MKNLLIVLVSILLFSCGGKNWDILPDKFNYKNITKFETDYSVIENELVVIEDQEFLEYWYSVLFEGKSDDYKLEQTEYRTSHFHAWQSKENSAFQEFTIASKNECKLEIHYVVMDAKGKIVSQFLVASENTCVGAENHVKTVLNNDNTFTQFAFDGDYDFLYPKETSTICEINSDGKVAYKEPVMLEPVICLWEKLTIKKAPEVKGKYLTSVYQGEVLIDLNESKIDTESKDKVEYIKVQLSDGTIGWIQSRFVAQKAGVGVLLDKSFIYSRPNEINKSDNYFNAMDIVAVLEFSEDMQWAKVKGKPEHEKWFKEGWVKNGLSKYRADVKVAGLTKNALKTEKWEDRYDQLKMIADNVAFQESNFLKKVNQLMTESPNNKNNTVLKLKWKHVAIDQYGSTFSFENEKGDEISFGYIDTPEINYESNPYYTWYESEESMFGRNEINEDIVDKWYWVTFEVQKVQPELSDEMIDADVIINIQPVE